MNARMRAVTLQGGTSSGNVIEDSCGVVHNHPEYYIFGPWGGTGGFLDTFLGGLGQWPQAFCHRESGWKTNVKGLAIYNLPKADIQVSGTFRSLPYPGNEFPSVQSQSLGGTALAFNIPGAVNTTSLGRPLGSGNTVEFLNVVQPGALYGNRLNAVDLRLSKVLNHGIFSKEGKIHVNFDLYNLFNSDTTEVYQRNYSAPSTSPRSTYLDPLSIMAARTSSSGRRSTSKRDRGQTPNSPFRIRCLSSHGSCRGRSDSAIRLIPIDAGGMGSIRPGRGVRASKR